MISQKKKVVTSLLEPYFVPGMKVIIEKSGLTEYMKVFLLKLGITDSMGKTAPTDYNNVHNVLKNLGVDERKTFVAAALAAARYRYQL